MDTKGVVPRDHTRFITRQLNNAIPTAVRSRRFSPTRSGLPARSRPPVSTAPIVRRARTPKTLFAMSARGTSPNPCHHSARTADVCDPARRWLQTGTSASPSCQGACADWLRSIRSVGTDLQQGTRREGEAAGVEGAAVDHQHAPGHLSTGPEAIRGRAVTNPGPSWRES